MEVLAESILNFWFGDISGDGTVDAEKSKRWFKKDEIFDKSIERVYGSYLDTAVMGGLDRWANDPKSITALIVMLDQFPRNVYRGLEKSFIYDKKALALANLAVDKNYYKEVPAVCAYFQAMPFMHSEDIKMQDKGIKQFEWLIENTEGDVKKMMEMALDFAQKHRVIIEKYGRFPHRNAALYRESTAEEVEFLKGPDSSF